MCIGTGLYSENHQKDPDQHYKTQGDQPEKMVDPVDAELVRYA